MHKKPAPDDPRKPDSPSDLTRRSWGYLATFPAALAMVSLLGLIGQTEESVDKALEVLGPLVSDRTIEAVEPSLRSPAASEAAGPALVVGLAGAL